MMINIYTQVVMMNTKILSMMASTIIIIIIAKLKKDFMMKMMTRMKMKIPPIAIVS